jgi:cytochrome P450
MQTLAQLPTLKGLPLVGSILEYRRDFLGLLRHVADQGDLATFKIMGEQLVLVNSPELLYQLLVEHGHKLNKSDDSLDASRPLAGHGLFNIEEKYHKQDRKLLAAEFTPKAVAQYGDLIIECVDDQLAGWQDGEEIPVGKAMVQLTVRLIGRIALGVDLLAESESLWKTFTVAFERMRDYMAEIVPLPLSFPTPSHNAYRKAVADLDALIYRLIEEHRRGDNTTDDVINRLLRVQAEGGEGVEMTDEQIRDEVVTMLVAGHETTANALSFAWAEMACNDEIYHKAVDQVDSVLEGRVPTPEDLKKLPYIGQIFHESLRKYPPFYILDRQNMEPIVLGDCEMPKDTIILFSPYTMHHTPAIYPDPERFDPDRFAPEKMSSIPRMGFIPFSGGHRVCLGKALATMEASLIMVRFLQKVRLVSRDKKLPKPQPMITLRPDPSFRLWLARR